MPVSSFFSSNDRDQILLEGFMRNHIACDVSLAHDPFTNSIYNKLNAWPYTSVQKSSHSGSKLFWTILTGLQRILQRDFICQKVAYDVGNKVSLKENLHRATLSKSITSTGEVEIFG